jgi:transposase
VGKYCPRLSEKQVNELKGFVGKKETEKAEIKRAQAILLLDKRTDIGTISEVTGYRRRQIFDLRREYLSKGLKGIESERKGKPKELLTKKQLKEIVSLLKSKRPCDLTDPLSFDPTRPLYEGDFWTTSILADYIQRVYAISYRSKTSYYLLFKRVKFTYHKPGRVYVKRDEKEVKKWREEVRPKIEKAWRDEKTTILCADEMILSTQTTLQKIWLPEGEYPQVQVSNTRRTISLYGFLNLKTGEERAFTAEKQTMKDTRKILGRLRKIYPKSDNKGNKLKGKKLLILWDNPGWHRGSAVKDFLLRDGKIEVIYFPKYAPEENPQEHVWKEGRAFVTHNKYIPDLDRTAKDFVKYLHSKHFPYSLLGFSAKS